MINPSIPYYQNQYYRRYNKQGPLSHKNLPIEKTPETRSLPEPKKENKNAVFEIFGNSLEFDDLLILGLLFFLYIEEVDDYSLYIVLILLLLS